MHELITEYSFVNRVPPAVPAQLWFSRDLSLDLETSRDSFFEILILVFWLFFWSQNLC